MTERERLISKYSDYELVDLLIEEREQNKQLKRERDEYYDELVKKRAEVVKLREWLEEIKAEEAAQ